MINEFTFDQLVITPLLTKREFEVLDLLSRGYSIKQIAEFLNLTRSGVKNHMNSLSKKFWLTWEDEERVNNRVERMVLIYNRFKDEIRNINRYNQVIST